MLKNDIVKEWKVKSEKIHIFEVNLTFKGVMKLKNLKI